MAAVVYGGSPRHHSRIANAHNLHHPSTLPPLPTTVSAHHHQQQQQIQTHHSYNMSPSNTQTHQGFSYSHQQQSTILAPPSSYLSTGTPMSSSTSQQQQPVQQQPLSYHHHQFHQQSLHHQQQQQQQSHYHHSSVIYSSQRHHSKRKSAVELLAETKPFYVKSETVLDRHQHLNFRNCGQSPVAMATPTSSPACVLSPSRTHACHRSTSRRSASNSSDLLQTKLRKLLNADGKDCTLPEIPRYKSDSQKYDTFSKYQATKYNQELSVHAPSDQVDHSVMFPSAFLSPQSLPPNPPSDDDIYSYGIDDPLVLTEDYRAISPPAEYAAADSSPEKGAGIRCNYQRSYSHSHEVASDDPDYSSPTYNINSHKSLPDLHSQISRHSPHSEALSCCSRGNRSNKSGGGSSLNRDSGGSSGHYTHRSEPCCKQKELSNVKICNNSDFRRDSGSSTQHSGNSYYTYGNPSVRYDCPECRAKIQKDSECLLNFTTPEVPEAFQDEYPTTLGQHRQQRYYDESAVVAASKRSSRKYYQQQQKQSPTTKSPDMGGGGGKDPELSPPLGTFKRQKCLRFKHRNRYSTSNDRNPCRDSDEDRKPILRSKSDISDRYWGRNAPLSEMPKLDKRIKSEGLSQLERFFERLGLNDDKFDEIYAPKRRYSSDNDSDQSSTVFFSDVSTVDSTRLPDSTETNQNTQAYRPTEPPSIVERNARIIKWLCNCRKLQLI